MQGVDSELVSLENIIQRAGQEEETPSGQANGDSESLGQPFYDRLAKLFGERIRECGNRVPVVTGEQRLVQVVEEVRLI